MKNLRKCWGFVKIDFLDRNLTFRIVWTKIVFHFDSKIYIRNHVILVRTTIRNPPECGNLSGPGLFKQWIRTFKFPDFTAILSAVTIIVLEIVIRGFSLNINYKVLKNETFGYAKYYLHRNRQFSISFPFFPEDSRLHRNPGHLYIQEIFSNDLLSPM